MGTNTPKQVVINIPKPWEIIDLEFANSIRSYQIKDEANRSVIEALLKKLHERKTE